MTNQERRRHAIRCTDTEWELIQKNANLEHMSVSRFLVSRGSQASYPLVLSPDDQKHILRNDVLTPDDRMKILIGIRVLTANWTHKHLKQGKTPEEMHQKIDEYYTDQGYDDIASKV